jgi:hypothetical protein
MADDSNTIKIPERPVPAALLRARQLNHTKLLETHQMFLELIEVVHRRITESIALLDAGRTRSARNILEAQVIALDKLDYSPLAPPEHQ